MNEIIMNIDKIIRHIKEVAQKCHQKTPSLIAVSKRQDIAKIKIAYDYGLRIFAESYVQESIAKMDQLPKDITWHFIGKLQSNKLKVIAQNFAYVQTLSAISHAKKLNEHCLKFNKRLNVLIQINVDNEPQKAGIFSSCEDEIIELVDFVLHDCPNLKLQGLMGMCARGSNEKSQLLSFQRLTYLKEMLNAHFKITMNEMSMGMSGDFEQAIEAGSTMLRVGSALFGERI